MLCCLHRPVQHNGVPCMLFILHHEMMCSVCLHLTSVSYLCLAPVLLSVDVLGKCCVVSEELHQMKRDRVHSYRDWASAQSILFQHILCMTASLILSLIASSQWDTPGCRCCLRFCPLLFLSYETVAFQTHILLLMAAIKKLNTMSRDSLYPSGWLQQPSHLLELRTSSFYIKSLGLNLRDAWWQAYYQPQPCSLPLLLRRKPTYCMRRIWPALLNVVYASVRNHTHWPASGVNHLCTPWLLFI